MPPIEYRSFATTLQIRDDGDGRTICGVAVPYDVEVRIDDYTEVFRLGAFRDADPAVVPLTAPHPRDAGEPPIGISRELQEHADGLHGVWHVSKTQAGDEVLELIRDGALSGLSVGFVPDPAGERWSPDRGRVERHHATLDHVAVVRSPAYPTARIVGVRAATAPAAPLVRLALARRR